VKGGVETMPQMSKDKRKKIKKDLLDQLERSGHYGEYYLDLIDHYMELVDLKELLQNDIQKNGIRLSATNGNGFTTEKPNESVANLMKVSQQLLKLLSELGLKEPRESDENDAL